MSRFTLLAFSLTLLAATTSAQSSAQSLLPTNLPTCAQQCTALQQGATGCLPAGGAPQSNPSTYQSCFCQSALLTQLYTDSAVQLCTSCQASDMLTIQNWYKNTCGKGGAPLPGGNQVSSASAAAATAAATGTQAANNFASPTSSSSPVVNNGPPKSWISTHYQWIIMLIVLILGMGAFAYGFWALHRRYHNKRIANWSTNPASQPDINTWTPGQSVHDLSWTARQGEKNSARTTLSSINPPVPAKEKPGSSPLRFF